MVDGKIVWSSNSTCQVACICIYNTTMYYEICDTRCNMYWWFDMYMWRVYALCIITFHVICVYDMYMQDLLNANMILGLSILHSHSSEPPFYLQNTDSAKIQCSSVNSEILLFQTGVYSPCWAHCIYTLYLRQIHNWNIS